MGRPRKQAREPFWRSDRDCWYVHAGGKQERLSPDKDEAYRIWHQLMSRPPEERRALPTGESAPVVAILDAFLEWPKTQQAQKTYTTCRRIRC